MVWYTAYIDQLMLDMVVRLEFWCDEHNTKFQHHENLRLLSSHRIMKASIRKVLRLSMPGFQKLAQPRGGGGGGGESVPLLTPLSFI